MDEESLIGEVYMPTTTAHIERRRALLSRVALWFYLTIFMLSILSCLVITSLVYKYQSNLNDAVNILKRLCYHIYADEECKF